MKITKITFIPVFLAIGFFAAIAAAAEPPKLPGMFYHGDLSVAIYTHGHKGNFADHMITDPDGKKCGQNPNTDDFITDEFGCSYGSEGPTCLDDENADPSTWRCSEDKSIGQIVSSINIVDGGVYTLEVIGVDDTFVDMVVRFHNRIDRKHYDFDIFTMVDKNTIQTFKLKYDSKLNPPTMFIRVATLGSLKGDIRLARKICPPFNDDYNLDPDDKRKTTKCWLDNDGIMNSLLKKAEAAEDAANRGQYKAAVNQLKALINEVKAQTGKHLDERAATILTEDAEYLIKELEAK